MEAVNRKISQLFCFVSHGCTVSARSVLSMSDDVGRCIALQSVPFFASGEQGQAELCLHFRVGVLERFQKSRHGDGGFACGGYSLRAGGVGFGIEAAFKLLAQLYTGGLLDMSVGVHQHIRTGVSCSPLHRLDVAAGDHQLVGGAGMPQTVKDDTGELRVCVLPFQEFFEDEHRFHRKQKGIVQKLVDLMEGSAGEGALLLLGREVSPLAAHILPAGGLAQGVVQGFDVVGPQLLFSFCL